jgi:hypothetical protein
MDPYVVTGMIAETTILWKGNWNWSTIALVNARTRIKTVGVNWIFPISSSTRPLMVR